MVEKSAFFNSFQLPWLKANILTHTPGFVYNKKQFTPLSKHMLKGINYITYAPVSAVSGYHGSVVHCSFSFPRVYTFKLLMRWGIKGLQTKMS